MIVISNLGSPKTYAGVTLRPGENEVTGSFSKLRSDLDFQKDVRRHALRLPPGFKLPEQPVAQAPAEPVHEPETIPENHE